MAVLDDHVSEQLACRILGVRSLANRRIPMREVEDQGRFVAVADLIGQVRRSRVRMKDIQEFENDPDYVPEREERRWVPISQVVELLDNAVEMETLLRWVSLGKCRSRTVNNEIHLDRVEMEMIGGGSHTRAAAQ